jgi:hypothetical protein
MGLLWSIPVTGARNVDLATWSKPGQGLEVWGALADDGVGWSVGGAGDVNKDGYQDVLIGAYNADVSTKVEAGIAYLVFGSSSRSTSTIDTASAMSPKGIKIAGVAINDHWGWSVSSAGDFNKDGIDDFVVGSLSYSPPSRTGAGAAVVIFGKTSGWADIDLATFTSGTAGFWIYGAAAGDQTGHSVSGVGDMNGDGTHDIIVGANLADPPSKNSAGTSYVLFGHSTATAFNTIQLSTFTSGSVGFRIFGAAVGDQSGYSVSGAGDVNRDGYADIVVGAASYDGPAGTDSGAAYVIFGHSAASTFTDIDLAALSPSQGFRITGAAANHRLGFAVSSAGDFNNDGYDDIVVGSPPGSKAHVLFGHSNSTAFHNVDLAAFVTGTAGFAVSGGGELGFCVKGGVDVNDDGVDDLVIAAPTHSTTGVAYLLYGRPDYQFGNINVLSGLSSTSGYQIIGAAAAAKGWWSVGLAGDFDGDGVGDVLVGAHFGDPSGRADAGVAYLVYGELSAPTSQPSRQPTAQPSRQPTSQPTSQPSRRPTAQPTRQPTAQPSRQPSARPTSSPVSERSGDVDLASWTKPRQGLEVWGAAANDNTGLTVASAGDVNKDGRQDVLIGAFSAELPGRNDAGVVYLVFGAGSRLTSVVDTAGALYPKGIKILGATAQDWWGWSVCGAGDVNKDGIDDFVLGSLFYSPPSRTAAGAAVVIFGKTSGWADIDLASFTSGSAGFWIWGAAGTEGCGRSLSSAGDVNGDGAGDFIVGATQDDPSSRSDDSNEYDRVLFIFYVIFGHSTATAFATVDLSAFSTGSTGFKIHGAFAGSDSGGGGMTSAGDVNGDGYSDIIIGAWLHDGPCGNNCGAAHVIFGHSTATAFTDIDLAVLSGSQGFRITGAVTNDRLGYAVSSAGDFNNDGYGDVVIGSLSNKAYIWFGHSTASAFIDVDLATFTAGTAGFTVSGSGNFGYSVSGGVDVNGDWVDDIIVAAPTVSPVGVTYVLYGRSQQHFVNIDVLTVLAGVSGYRVLGEATSANSRWSVSVVRDFDGDGVGDILVGARYADPSGRTNAGAAYLVYGELSAPTSQPSRQPTSQPSVQPSRQPTAQPSRRPSSQPTAQPSRQPTAQPSRRPSSQPTAQPSRQPTAQPSRQPSARPTSSPVSERSGDVDLATWTKPRQGLEVWGGAAADSLGVSVCGAGDVNKDGFQDILVGAHTVDVSGLQNAGAAYVVFGSGSRSTSAIDTASAMPPKGVKITGVAANDYLGVSVGAAGDFNKDGIDDFIVGSSGYDPSSRGDAGAAVVIFGKTSGWADVNLASFTSGSAGFWIYGAADGDLCGYAVSSVGDMNGDGAGDVVVGAFQSTPLGRASAGASYVIFGHSTATAFDTVDLSTFVSGTAGFKILGATANDNSGDRVSSAGDVNRDGYGDAIISARLFDGVGGSDCGAAYVIFGHSTATAFTDINLAVLSPSQGFRITGAAAGNQLGWSVSSAGDFNNDGFADIVLGTTANKAYVLLGHTSATPFPDMDMATFTAGTAGFDVVGDGGLGDSVWGGTDVNGDGVHDVVITAHTLSSVGAAVVLYGRSQHLFVSINMRTGLSRVSGYRILGEAASMSGGWSVGLVRDFDGDGVGDILLGAQNADPSGRIDAGTTYLVYGELSAPTSQPSRQPTSQPSRQPTAQPSVQPSRQPTAQPSRQPTSQPSRQPSTRPTSSPVSERAGDVDLATWATPRQGLQVWGAAADDRLGNAVSAGDFNNDGYQDILAGSYAADVLSRTNAGAAYVVFGSGSRSTSVIDTASAIFPAGVRIFGAAAGDWWGYSVSSVGDLNKDGINDFVIGGYQFDPPSRSNAGAAVVIFGKTSGWADIDLASFTSGTAGFWIWGAADNDHCGISVGASGDVNGDGAQDVLVGAQSADPQSRSSAGITYLIFGHSTVTPFNTIDLATFSSGSAGFKIFGATAGDESGWRVSGAGDFNRDGYGDIIVGAWMYDSPGAANCGAAYVIFGHSAVTAFTNIDLAVLSSGQGFRITGAGANSNVGVSVSTAGDFNNDGCDDIIIGSQGNKAYVIFGHANITVIPDLEVATFPAGNAGFTVSGSGDIGYSVSGGTDINGDGVDDLVITAPSYSSAGAIYALYGRAQAQFANIDLQSGLPGVTGYAIIGAGAAMVGEWSVSLVRDFDGDGVGDVLVGARHADPSGRTDAGAAYLVYGELSAPTSQPSRQPTSQPSSQPTSQPFSQPSSHPSTQPSKKPSGQPSRQPTAQPSRQPTAQPSMQPNARPTSSPVSERSGDVDLATWTKPKQGLEVWGALSDDNTGSSVADAGDVNKDGFHDMLIGAAYADLAANSNVGAAYLVFGSPDRSTSIIDTVNALPPKGIKISGVAANDRWGVSVSGIGDFNKDGIDDFIVGGHQFDPPSRANAGGAVVIFGKTSGWADIDLASFTSGSAGFWIWGATAGDTCGIAVSGAGDVNGDGADDVLIGAYQATSQGASEAGISYVIFGRGPPTVFATVDLSSFSSGDAGFKIHGAAAGDNSGSRLSGARDLNGDGYAEIIIAAQFYDKPNHISCGAAFVVFGHSTATSFADVYLASHSGFQVTGAAASDRLGYAVRSAGDFNKDGYDDMVIGSQANKVYVLFGHSNETEFADVDLATFTPGSAGFVVSGSGDFGYAVAGGVDVNRDGVDDVVIAAPTYAPIGVTYVLYGRPQHHFVNINVLSGFTSLVGYRIVGAAAGSNGQWSIGLVRDFDGDGVGDIVLGAQLADPFTRDAAGTVYVVYGELSAPTSQPSSQPTQQPSGRRTAQPSAQPSRLPTAQPSRQPISQPSVQPSRQPTAQPSRQPTAQPSRQPSARPTSSPVSERSGDVDLATWTKPRQGLEVWGALAGDNAGSGVADAGDVNKDGYRDVLIGAVKADMPGKTNAGAVYLVFGTGSRLTSDIDTASAISPRGIKIAGATAQDWWGWSVSGAGDFNGDGIDDIIVGGYWVDPPSRTDAGAAVVIFGKTSGWADINLAAFPSGSAGFWIWGAAAGDQCGVGVSGAGDVNGDGIQDVVVGANRVGGPNNRPGAGATYVIFGHSTATSFDTIDLASFTSGSAGFRVFGATAEDISGTMVGDAGDINRDGYADIIVGAYAYDRPGVTNCGAAYVIFGHSAATAFTDIDLAALSPSQGFRITGAAANNNWGYFVGNAGDFNHDGYDDILVGSQANKALVLFGHPSATTFPNVDLVAFTSSAVGLMVSGTSGFGLTMGGGTDVNGDGVDDIIITAPASSPKWMAYVLYGRSQLQFADINVQSGLSSKEGFSIIGPAASMNDYCSITAVKDFDGDGVGDILVADSLADPSNRIDAGSAYLIYGELSAPTSQPSRQPTRQPSRQPTLQPSGQPTSQPSRQPTSQPSGLPSRQPASQPSAQPSRQPTAQPSRQPTSQPSRQPSSRPSRGDLSERAGDVDLATWIKPAKGLEVWGALPGETVGWSVADAGDLNHDGHQDVLVCAYAADVSGKVDVGRVYLVFGSPSRSTNIIDTAGLIAPMSIKITGLFDYDYWGMSAKGVGDFNADGIDDFIIGGFQYDPPSRTHAGAAVVIFGKTSGWADIDLASFTSGSAGFWVWGAAAGDQCGTAVSGVGDVNGDGVTDLIIGAAAVDALDREDAGASYVLFGHSAATPFNTTDLSAFTSGSAGFKIIGATAGDNSGYSVGGAGDINHDGFSDVIVGAYLYDGPAGDRTSCGAAYVIFGHSSSTAFTNIDLAALSNSQGFSVIGAAANDRLGHFVSSAGDFNHDGYDDVLVGSKANKVYVFDGHSTSTPFLNVDLVSSAAGSAGCIVAGDGIGFSGAGGVDINGDGVHDIILGAPFAAVTGAGAEAGVVYVLYGKPSVLFSYVDLSAGLPSVSGFCAFGTAALARTGFSVSLLEDFDGDGLGDLIVGAYNAQPSGRASAGITYVIYGELSAPTSQPSRQPSGQPSRQPTAQPTMQPTLQPSNQPSAQPFTQPTAQPSRQPTAQPSRRPSSQPTAQPSRQPTAQPSRQPSALPTGSPVSERSGDVDLATWTKPRQGLEVWGALAGDNAGSSVADAGDVNKDGYRDVLIGAAKADMPGKVNAGAVYLVFGSGSRLTDTVDTASAVSPKGIKIAGAAAQDWWGLSIGGAGDFNDDGIDDVIIGGYWVDPPWRTDAGAAVVIFGKTSGWADIDLASFPSGSAGFWIWGAAAGDQCGISVSGAGDVNGDGIHDVVVGGNGVGGPNSRLLAGATYVIFGHSTATSFDTIDLASFTSGNAGFRIFGATAGDISGYVVSSAGDINRDGYADIIVGAYAYDRPGVTNCGAAYVIFGHSAASAFADIDLAALSPSQGFRITGAAVHENWGNFVGSAGDFNHDGYDDILVGSQANKALVLFGHPSATTFPNVDLVAFTSSAVGLLVSGPGGFGWTMGGGTDVNGDGVDDIVFTAPTSSPKWMAYVLYGRSQLQSADINVQPGLSSAIGFSIVGSTASQNGYCSITAVKDFDGDGVGDIVVADSLADPSNRIDAGSAYLIYGELSAPTSQPSRQPTGQPSRQPTLQPSGQPTSRPSRQPSGRPSRQPTQQPSGQPTGQTSRQPTSQPSGQPSRQPTLQPTTQPSEQPSAQPSSQPSSQPSRQPSAQSTSQPSTRPSSQPTAQPYGLPSGQPSLQPTRAPTSQPSVYPSGQPSRQPTSQPSAYPSGQPSVQPSRQPTAVPSTQPSTPPSSQPSGQPTACPTSQPSRQPTSPPTARPTVHPTKQPTSAPTSQPMSQPTKKPSQQPSGQPSCGPSRQPTQQPSATPSAQPSTAPTIQPSSHPTGQPNCAPSAQPSKAPSVQPSSRPTGQPRCAPSSQPSAQPTQQPSTKPSALPSAQPVAQPSEAPSGQPSRQPSMVPSCQPSVEPSAQPTRQPTECPSSSPSCQPSSRPSTQPSLQPTSLPSCAPSCQPSGAPSAQPTGQPTGHPSWQQVSSPSAQPSRQPSGVSSTLPTGHPSVQPTCAPSRQPYSHPSAQPTGLPSTQPSRQPTQQPVCSPSTQPTSLPSAQPSRQPTRQPSRELTMQPTVQPSSQPSCAPSRQPIGDPTTQPTAQPTRQPTRRPSRQPTSAPTTIMATPATLDCSVLVVHVGRTFVSAKVALYGASDGNVRLYGMINVGETSRSVDVIAAALQHDSYRSVQINGLAPATANVSNLLPYTDYDIYCSAASSQGVTMSLSSILATKQSLRTTCCKAINVNILHPATVNLGQEVARAVTLALDAPPTSSIVVTVQYAVRGQSATDVQLLPSVLRYDNSSAAGMSKDIKLTALAAGNYTLSVSATGYSAHEYSVIFSGTRRLAVLRAEATPAVPQLLQAAFSNDGAYVTLSFDSATDRGSLYGTFPCNTLLRLVGVSAAQCQWFSDNLLRVYTAVVGAGPVLGVSGNVTLVASTVRARCTDTHRAAGSCASYVPAVPATVVVAAPSAPTVPSVVISAPSTIGGCNTLTLDLTSSVGAAGRAWDAVSFTVSSNPASANAAHQLQLFLLRNYTLNPPLPVPSAVLAKGYAYSIKAQLCNFLKACGSATKVVSVVESVAPVPVVTIAGHPVRAVYRTDGLSVVADGYTQSCDGGKSAAGLQYTWTVAQLLLRATSHVNVTLRSVSQNPTVFKLPAYTLSVGATYTLVVLAQSVASGRRSSATVQVKVAQSDILAVLKGGSTRYAVVGDVFALDASGSYDKDYPQQSLPRDTTTYTWHCLTVAPVLSAVCAITLVEPTPGRSGAINVTSTYPALNTTSVVSITVADASRTSTAQVRIIVLQAPSPHLTITAVGPVDNVNTGKPFTLLGSLYLLAPCAAAWSVDDPTIALAVAARTPVQQMLFPSAVGASVAFNLVIKSDALPQRATLHFTLSCGRTTVSTIVTTNGAPLPGTFSVNPEIGVELSTVFTFSAAQWSDPDLPLTYQFGFQSAVSLSSLVIVSRSELSHATSSLPAGDGNRANAVDCSLRVFDGLGAYTDRVTAARVDTQDDAGQATQLVLELLKSSSASVQGVKTALAVGSSFINAVNCTAAPSCAPLNRHPCRMTSAQCGACLDGFLGDAGDRSTLCVALTASPVQLSVPKSCAFNCSGHGHCTFVSKITGATVAKCTLANADCEAVCACVDNYSGDFCDLDSVTLRRRREVRSNLIMGLSNLTIREDINAESVTSWSANLYALSIRPQEVSQADANILADIANTTLQHAIALGVDSYTDMLGVLQATDTVASLQRYNYNPNDYRDADFNTSHSYVNNTAARFVPVVSTFGDMVSNLMVLGENETTLLYDNFRMTVTLAAGSHIQEPHRVLAGEQQEAAAASSVALQTATDALVSAVAVKVISTHPRSYAPDTADYVSSPVRLQVQALEPQHSSVADYLTSVQFTFQHNVFQTQYMDSGVRNFSSTCAARNASQVFTYRCPDSGHVIRHNCSQGVGVHVSYCPKPAAACAMLALETAELTTPSACTVLNSTAAYTVCRCTVSGTSASKRRSLATTEQQILDATGATNMLATAVFIASDFTDTFHAAGALNNVTLSSVLVIVLLLGSVWVTGLSVLALEWAANWWSPAKQKITKDSSGVQSIMTYVDSVIPKVFERGTSSVQRLVVEIAQHHVLFQLFTADTPAERWFLMMQALTELTLLFFLTAAFFDISQPGDDGTCLHYTAKDSCLERVCPFDYSQTFCKWVANDDGTEVQCLYNDQDMSATALFYMTVLTTVISSIVSVPIDYQFSTLKAPTALSLEGSKVSTVIDTVVTGARRVSNAGLAFFEPARVAPAPSPVVSPKSGIIKGRSFRFMQVGDGVVANREIPTSLVEVGAAARGSLDIVGRNASILLLRAEGTSRALRSRSTRVARRSTTAFGGSDLNKRDGAVVRLAEPTVLTSVGVDADDEGAVLLLQDIVHQRLLMNSSAKETKLYDARWGVVSNEAGTYTIRPEAADYIAATVSESSKEASRVDKVLNNYSLQHAGLEMLHLFMLDLLGRNTIAAKIFREKFGEEFGHSRVVMAWHKYFAAAALFALNAFFVYFVMIKGIEKGRDWQMQYVTCCLAQIGVDILLFETVECAWLNFLVPQYVHQEVACAAEKLRSLTLRITGLRTDIEEAQQEQEATKFFLNAPAHLFVSTKLAMKKPQLLESIIVISYRHHLPGEICKTWPHCSEIGDHQLPTQARTWLSLLRRGLRGLTLSLQLFIGVPFAYQKVALRCAQPVVFSGVALIIYTIVTSVAGLVVLSGCIFAAVVYAVQRWWSCDGPTSAVDQSTDDVEEPTFNDDAFTSDSSVEFSSVEEETADECSEEIEFWNAEYDDDSDDSVQSIDSGSPLARTVESSDGMCVEGDTLSMNGESEDYASSGSDVTEEPSLTLSSDDAGPGSHSEQESTGSGAEGIPSSQPDSWGEASGGGERHGDSSNASDERWAREQSELLETQSSSSERQPDSWDYSSGNDEDATYGDFYAEDSSADLHLGQLRLESGGYETEAEPRAREPPYSDEESGASYEANEW